MRVRAITCSLALFLTVGCDDDGGGSGNQGCESGCIEDYLGVVDSCENETVDCMGACSSPEDTSCMLDCEEFLYDCDFEMMGCMANCPCNEALSNCAADCDYDDSDCINACGDKYQNCAGNDSPYTSSLTCSTQKYTCLWDCEEMADMSDYLDCRAVCHEEYTDCLGDCV